MTDCFDNELYRLRKGKIDLWLEAPEMKKPNGLICTPRGIAFVKMEDGKFYHVDRESRDLALLCDGIENADGIASDGEEGFFISGAWQGHVYHVTTDGRKSLVLDLGKEKMMAADIEYVPEKRLLIVPTLGKTVRGYRW